MATCSHETMLVEKRGGMYGLALLMVSNHKVTQGLADLNDAR
ncbi:MAG: hypothetical protein ACYC5X_07585 [Syntrophales bacterium]